LFPGCMVHMVVVVVGYIEKRATDKCLCVRRVLERAPATRISNKNPTAESPSYYSLYFHSNIGLLF
jgi:hypothetical protein